MARFCVLFLRYFFISGSLTCKSHILTANHIFWRDFSIALLLHCSILQGFKSFLYIIWYHSNSSFWHYSYYPCRRSRYYGKGGKTVSAGTVVPASILTKSFRMHLRKCNLWKYSSRKYSLRGHNLWKHNSLQSNQIWSDQIKIRYSAWQWKSSTQICRSQKLLHSQLKCNK